MTQSRSSVMTVAGRDRILRVRIDIRTQLVRRDSPVGQFTDCDDTLRRANLPGVGRGLVKTESHRQLGWTAAHGDGLLERLRHDDHPD